MRPILVFVLACTVTACNAVPQQQTVVETKIPVTVKCVTEMPAKPVYATPMLQADASDYDKVSALASDWVRSRIYEPKLEAALAACK